MDTSMIIAAVVGLGAALAIMYMVLKKYTYPAVEQPFFSDPKFFGLFTVGLVAGTAIVVVYSYSDMSSIIYAIMFALVFELAKLIVLNLKRFHGNSDTIFYGFGIGLGIGGAFSFGLVFLVLRSFENVFEGTDILILLMLFGIIAVQTVLIQSATGLTIGEGVARRRPFEFLLQALIISISYQLLMSQVFRSMLAGSESETGMYIFLILSFVVALGYFYSMVYIKLPSNIREVLRREGKNRKDIPK